MTKDCINICLSDSSATPLAAAIRWLIKANICKKRSQTENRSLAFESRKEYVDSQMEHVQFNELSRFKLMDSNIKLPDLLDSEILENTLNAQPMGINSISRRGWKFWKKIIILIFETKKNEIMLEIQVLIYVYMVNSW